MSYDFQVFDQKFRPTPVLSEESKFNDTNALGFSWRPGREMRSGLVQNCQIDGSGCSEGLKLSFVYNMDFKNCQIIGGREDCVDIVRGGDISFEGCEFISNNSKQHVTIKGGAKNISFKDCTFQNDYRCWWDGACIDLGNWTDYDEVLRPPVRNVSVDNCKMKNMKRRTLTRRLFSMDPLVENSDGRNVCVPVLFVRAFWFLQRKGWVGKRRRFPEAWLKIYDGEL